MAKIKLACKSCGKGVEREEKPAPKNNKEAKQIRFNCPCGATNLRDGSAVVAEKKAKKPVKPVKDPVQPALVEPVNKPVKPVKQRVRKPVTPKEPVKPVEKPVDRSETHGNESESSPVIIE